MKSFWWRPIFPASSITPSSICRPTRAWCRWSCSATRAFHRSASCPTFSPSGPHAFYWFKLEPPQISASARGGRRLRAGKIGGGGRLGSIFFRAGRGAVFERTLPAYFLSCRWFGGKAQQIRSVKNIDVIPFDADGVSAYITTWEVQFLGATPESYLLPLAFAAGDRAFELRQANPQARDRAVKIKEKNRESEGLLYDALYDANFCKALLMRSRAGGVTKAGASLQLAAQPSKVFRKLRGGADAHWSRRCSNANKATLRWSTATG